MAEPRWGLREAAAGFVLAVVASALASALVLSADATADTPEDLSLAWRSLLQLPLWVGLLGAPLWATWRRGNGPVADLGLRMRPVDAAVGVPVGVAAQFLVYLVIYEPLFRLTDVTAEDVAAPARELTDLATDAAGVVLLVAVVGIGAPVVEELFYRGMVQRALLRSMRPLLAVTTSAAVFGISHFQLLQLPALFAVGLVLGHLAHRSGRLGPAIWAHVAFNLTAVVQLLVFD